MRMKLFIIFLIGAVPAIAQDECAEWYFTLANSMSKVEREKQLIISANLSEGWGLYGLDFQPASIGPLPTRIDFTNPDGYTLISPVLSLNALRVTDEAFDVEYSYFKSKAEFRQCFRLIHTTATINGTISGFFFDLNTGKTKPFQKQFSFKIE